MGHIKPQQLLDLIPKFEKMQAETQADLEAIEKKRSDDYTSKDKPRLIKRLAEIEDRLKWLRERLEIEEAWQKEMKQ